MDALEKLAEDLQVQGAHADLPSEEGSRQWHTAVHGSITRKVLLSSKASL